MNEDLFFTAFALAVSEVLSAQVLETRAIVEVLRVKGLLSISEYTEANERILAQSSARVAESMALQLKKRMAEHVSRLRVPEKLQ
jgi:hypothetical protein